MQKQTFGEMISSLRKEKGMTQLELAEKMGVTDKAVSKWERNLSFPDVSSLPRLAEIFGITVDELIQAKGVPADEQKKTDVNGMICLICKAVTVAMGVAVAALSAMKKLDVNSGLGMLGVGLFAAGICLLMKKD